MKIVFLMTILLTYKLQAACLSENLVATSLYIKDMKVIEDVVTDFEMDIRRELPPEVSMVINLEPLNPRVNAEILKKEDNIIINVMGGMLGHSFMSEGAMKLLLCHEVGHLLAGPPLKSRNGWSSTEGQADYYSGKVCSKNVGLDDQIFIESALNLSAIYAQVSREPIPKIDVCEERRVDRTNYGYPSVQCRLDTMIAGRRGLERPHCWFKN